MEFNSAFKGLKQEVTTKMSHNKVQLFISGKNRGKSSNIFSHLVITVTEMT
jgi:hypothetical protein